MKEYYDRRAPEYDDWYLGLGRFAARDTRSWDADLAGLIETVAALPAGRTLDVACGTGFLTRHLAGDVVGLDQSIHMLDLACTRAPNANFVHGDGLALPFPNDVFSRVFTSHFYGHLDPDERGRFLHEARRVGHELVIADAMVRPDHAPEEIQQRELLDGTAWPVLKRYFTPESLIDELGGGETLYAGAWFLVVRAA